MSKTFTRRAVEYGLTLFVAVSMNFLLPRAMPGDPLALIAGDAVRQMGAEKIAELRQVYGLDQPLGVQYLVYLGRLVRGDLGQSYRFSGGLSVVEVIADRFGWTLFLVTVSLTLATLIGSYLGIWAARQQKQLKDLGLLTALFTMRAMPVYWLAMILIPIFAVKLQLLPTGDSYSIPRPADKNALVDILEHAVLPIAVLTFAYIPSTFAVMRSSMRTELNMDYIRTARAKGLRESMVVYRHALRNTLLPLVTLIGLDFGQLLGGVLLIEIVFNYRGLGNMMFEAVKSRDYPLIQGGFLVFTVGVLLINLITDQVYPRLDPRLRTRES
jgi:peptide/nickel transport system permease protein